MFGNVAIATGSLFTQTFSRYLPFTYKWRLSLRLSHGFPLGYLDGSLFPEWKIAGAKPSR